VNLLDFLPGTDNKREFVGIYTDEGISGTSTNKREGFQQMIADTLADKIDLIVTKI
jgi:DNA invertase Pin-like site-specific DNA recombinase